MQFRASAERRVSIKKGCLQRENGGSQSKVKNQPEGEGKKTPCFRCDVPLQPAPRP